jgi:DNA-directed RNA polymerase subunit RPC12/RpoP
MSFPYITYGKCPRCGQKSDDDATPNASGGTANSESDIRTGTGTVLEMFRGEYICHMCKKQILGDEESSLIADKHAEEQAFRDRVGFKRTIS